MRLIRFGPRGQEKPGILSSDGKRKDLSASFGKWDSEFSEMTDSTVWRTS